MEDATEGNEEQPGTGGINVEDLRSYAAFGKSAIKARKWLSALVVFIGIALTGLVARYIPRTYECTTVMMTVVNAVLDSDRGPQPLAGAEGLIMSHENLEALIKKTNLKTTYATRRPPLLKLKDKVLGWVIKPMDDKVLTAVLVGTLESRLSVKVERDTLTITVDWSDAKTAAELTEATREGFLQVRHTAEISAFQEKMAILDAHAGEMRQEIDMLAEQMKTSLATKNAERAAEAKKTGASPDAKRAAAAAPAAPRMVSTTRHEVVTDEQLPDLKERLAALKQKLSAAENDRNSRMHDEQAKLDELKLRLTPSHPQVITQEERVGMASQVSSDLALMRSEAEDLESQIRQREAMVKTGRPSTERLVAMAAGAGTGAGSEMLPTEILGLLDEKDADPALSAQMSGAVVRYASLRDDVRGAKLSLDTAQAAFTHRYQVVIPVDEPDKATKPKIPVIVGAGLFLSLLIAFALPILLELRRDLVVERWQVQHFQLPILGELQLPQGSKDKA